MARLKKFRDINVECVPIDDISRHIFWLNAKELERDDRPWPGYEIRHMGFLIGIAARRKCFYPFMSLKYMKYDDRGCLLPSAWFVLGSDLERRAYGTSLRNVVDWIIDPESSSEPNDGLAGLPEQYWDQARASLKASERLALEEALEAALNCHDIDSAVDARQMLDEIDAMEKADEEALASI